MLFPKGRMRRSVPFWVGVFGEDGISGRRGCCGVSKMRGDAVAESRKTATRISGLERSIVYHKTMLEGKGRGNP